MKILVVEDERKLAGLLKKGLEENDFAVDLAFDGEEGLHRAENYVYDAVLLDLMLPETDGLTVLRTLRKKGNDVPVLIVTARGEIGDKVEGLNIGADDYIAKPFDLAEVIARLRAAIRRNKGKPAPVVTVSDLAVDTNARTVTRELERIASRCWPKFSQPTSTSCTPYHRPRHPIATPRTRAIFLRSIAR